MQKANLINAAQITSNDTAVPPVAGRTLLLALGYSIGIAVILGVLTGFGLPLLVPALSNVDWLATIIVAEAYLAVIIGHVIAFGGWKPMRQRLQLEGTFWRNIGLAFGLWAAMWAFFVILFVVLGPSVPVLAAMSQAVLKIGSLYGRLANASPALMIFALIQPVFITPLAEELVFRGSLYGWLRGKFGAGLTILITSTLFALYHPLIYLWPMAFLFGLLAGWVRERTISLTPFCVVHVLNSIAMIAAAYFITGWRI